MTAKGGNTLQTQVISDSSARTYKIQCIRLLKIIKIGTEAA
jgi:hypothetical protein